jgi:D-apionolactonase
MDAVTTRAIKGQPMLNKNILLYGHDELPPKALTLRAGSLTMIFEPDNGFLRYIRLGDHEVVRNIYAVVRDQNWNTIAWKILNLKTDIRPDSFDLTFEVECHEREVDYVWKGAASGDASGRVTFSFDGEAKSHFRRNRIGICVLHPILECAGKSVTLEHTNGTREETGFPKEIAPWQPLRDVRAITQEVAAGVRAEIRFEGDVFETEDQRNYGDASFKTYSTPQELPKPVEVNIGDRVQHRVTVTLLNPENRKVLPVVQGRGAQHSISTTPVLAKPALGVRMARHGQPLTETEAERLRALRLAHLRGDVTFAHDWREELRAASTQAGQLRLPLQCALHLGPNPETELAQFARELEIVRPHVSLWIVYQDGQSMVPADVVHLARRHLAHSGAAILFAAGATPFFVEFNRKRPPADLAALPCYPINPQVHLRDARTMIENIPDVLETIESAQKILPQQVVISPITLRPWHKVPAGPDSLASGELPADVDPRQMSLFGAAWTLAHISRLALPPPLHSATYFETTGWRGLMETASASPLPAKFFSIPGAVFPIYFVLAEMAGFNRVCPTHSTHPMQTEALTLLDEQNRKRILVANLLPEEQEIKIKTGTCEARVKRLNGDTAEEAMRAPEKFRAEAGEPMKSASGKIELTLAPYEITRVDVL